MYQAIPHSAVTNTLAVLSLVLLSPVLGHAEIRESEEARALYEAAALAYDAHRFDEARVLLERSLELLSHPAPAGSLAQVLGELGELKAATEVLEGLLNGRYGELSPEQRSQAEVHLSEMRRQMATIVLHLEQGPREAEVQINEEPFRTLSVGERLEFQVNPGRHRITLEAPGHETIEETVELLRGEHHELSLILLPRTGRVVFDSHPQAEISIPGFEPSLGRLELELDPGEYTVRVSYRGGTEERSIELSAGQVLRRHIDRPSRPFYRHPAFWSALGTVVATSLGISLWLVFRDPEDDPDVRWRVEALTSQ